MTEHRKHLRRLMENPETHAEKVTLAIMESEATMGVDLGTTLEVQAYRLENLALIEQARKISEASETMGRMIRQKRIDLVKLEELDRKPDLCTPAGIPHDPGPDGTCTRCGVRVVG